MKFLMSLFFCFFSLSCFAEEAETKTEDKSNQANCTLAIEMRDNIGPATYDYLQQAEAKASEKNCDAILVKINTPGGSLQSTRKIVEMIMASERPYMCLVFPAGGRAGSAGAIIMQACHVNGMVEATNIGAASPVSGSGQEIPEDLRKKLFEDTKSFAQGLAKYHGRSEKFAREIVTEAKSLDAKSALKAGAVDVVVGSVDEFLEFAKKQKVRLKDKEKQDVLVGKVDEFPPGLRHQLMQIFSNPQWAYLLFMGSLGLLYFELTHPGTLFPGVVGAIGLVISLMNFHLLDVSWGGVLLILLGMAFMFAEIFIPSFGALGLGGLAAFIIGSLFLFDESSGYQVPLSLLITTSVTLGLLMFGLSYMAVGAMRSGRKRREDEKMEGHSLTIKSFDSETKKGMGLYQGELWKVVSTDSLKEGDSARITKVDGFTLTVEKDKGVI